MNRYTFIVNPEAGHGMGRHVMAELKRILHRKQVSHELVVTSCAGHATTLGREARSSVVVAVGGDGTVNEVANGLVKTEKVLGVIPAGSGNDFIKSISVPRRVEAAVERLLSGTRRRIDLGHVRCGARASNEPGRYFVNGVGIGFDAAVAERTRHIRILRGTALYLAAVLQTLGRFTAPHFTLRVDGKAYDKQRLLIAVGNGRCAGGGFYLTPAADVGDGLLDICAVDDRSVVSILRLMPRVMRGKHTEADGLNFIKGREISVLSDRPFYVHADGEIVGANVSELEIRVCPEALTIIDH